MAIKPTVIIPMLVELGSAQCDTVSPPGCLLVVVIQRGYVAHMAHACNLPYTHGTAFAIWLK